MIGSCGTKSLWDPPGWWGSGEYLFLWRKERFYPALASTGTLGSGGELLFGDSYERGNWKAAFRLDTGIWLSNCIAVGGSLILARNDPIEYYADTNTYPTLSRPYISASTGEQASNALLNFSDLDIDSLNQFWTIDGYGRYRFLSMKCWALDAIGGVGYIEFDDNLDVLQGTISSTANFTRKDQFHCVNEFYSGIVGGMVEIATNSWLLNFWGKVALGNMVKNVKIFGEENNSGTISKDGFLALPSNEGHYSSNQFECVPIFGANINLRVCGNFYLSAGYIGIYLPSVALAGRQVDVIIDPTQNTLAPIFDLHDTSFWIQGISIGAAIYY